MEAYTYTKRHLPANKIYYGVRKSAIEDIGREYFSSSRLVKRMIAEEPIENFKFKIRKKFESYSDARIYETRVLKRINAVSNVMVLNQAISSPRLCSKDPIAELKRQKSISAKMTELWETSSYRDNQSFNKLSSDEQSIRGLSGAIKRAENYASGKTQRKLPRKIEYKDTTIVRDSVYKIVKANQVPAYVKYGWARC